MNSPSTPTRIFYLEDNPLLVFHVQAMIEDLNYIFAGSLSSFESLKERFAEFQMDAALVDIDLEDGRTGPAATEWLHTRGIPSIFVTGQVQAATSEPSVSLATISKPVSFEDLAEKLEVFGPRDSQ